MKPIVGMVLEMDEVTQKSVIDMRPIFLFFSKNRIPLIGMVLGVIAGYLYWQHYGIYDGTFGFSSEWWVNCVYGLLFGGFFGSLVRK